MNGLRERWTASTERQRLLLLILVAVAVRVAIMPFTLHFDAYQIYSRAHEAAYHGQWFNFSTQIVIQTLHNVWLWMIQPLLPNSHAIWSETASQLGVGASRGDYQRFLDYPHVLRAIFLMKLPYVVADLACAWLIGRMVKPSLRLPSMAIWLLNPLVIFSSAIYGRHDAIAILMVLGAVHFALQATDRGRLVGLGLLGVATVTRFFPIVLVPTFVLAFHRTRQQLIGFLALLAGLGVLVEVAGWIASGSSTILTLLGTYEHIQYWFDAGFYLRFDDWILVFPVVYALGLLWLSERGVRPAEFNTFAAATFLLLFATTFFHPHYAIWLVPFLALVIPAQPNCWRLLAYHAIQVICVLIYSAQWGTWTTWGLLEPVIGTRVNSLPDPVEVVSGEIDLRLFFGLFRSILTATSLWMAWCLLRPLIRPRNA